MKWLLTFLLPSIFSLPLLDNEQEINYMNLPGWNEQPDSDQLSDQNKQLRLKLNSLQKRYKDLTMHTRVLQKNVEKLKNEVKELKEEVLLRQLSTAYGSAAETGNDILERLLDPFLDSISDTFGS